MTDETRVDKSAGWKLIAISLLFWLPLLSGVLSRVFKQSRWFGDYGAFACAAEKHLQGLPMYDMHLACPGMNVAMYIYHPIVAQTYALFVAAVGRETAMLSYALLFVLSVVALVWISVGRASSAPRRKRAWFGAFMTGSAIYWGNIAVVLHALIGVAAVLLRRWPLLLVIAIALAMVVKPLFATFAVIFLLARRPLVSRIFYAVLTVALGLAPSIWALYQGGEIVAQWRELLTYAVYVDRPGEAYFGWMSALGAPVSSLGVSLGYLGYAGLMTIAALVLAEGLDLSDDDRALFGLSIALLIIPRLMSQDYWLLGPGLLAISTAITARAPAAGRWFERALLWLCVLVLIGNLADLSDYTARIVTAGLVLTIFAAACWTLAANKTSLGAIWSALVRGAPKPANA